MRKLRFLTRVRSTDVRMTTVPAGTLGRVVKQDMQRSQAGYDTFVVWTTKLGGKRRHTWYPSDYLQIV